MQSWNQTLRDEGDFQRHSTEVILPRLSNGQFLITAASKDNNVFAFKHIQVTDLALIESKKTGQVVYQLLNRNNGNPITNTSVEISYQKRYNGKTFKETLKTDEFGNVQLALPDNNGLINVI